LSTNFNYNVLYTFQRPINKNINSIKLNKNSVISGVCVFTTDDGTVTIVDTSNNQHTTYQMGHPVFSAMYNPIQPEFLCVASYKGLFIYDVRNMKE
jgi:hypothetical protein